MRKYNFMVCAGALLLTLCACGNQNTSTQDSSLSAAPEASAAAEVSTVTGESSAEESTLEESVFGEPAPTADELFYEFRQTADGTAVKLQFYTRKGFPVKSGAVTVEALQETQLLENSTEDAEVVPETSTENKTDEIDLDESGFGFLAMQVGATYRLTVTDGDGELVGTATLALETGEQLSGADGEDNVIYITVPEPENLAVDAAITATDDDGTISVFSLSRISEWTEAQLSDE